MPADTVGGTAQVNQSNLLRRLQKVGQTLEPQDRHKIAGDEEFFIVETLQEGVLAVLGGEDAETRIWVGKRQRECRIVSDACRRADAAVCNPIVASDTSSGPDLELQILARDICSGLGVFPYGAFDERFQHP